jgi:PhoPQ-activated pathogenicity-related protein
MSRIRTRQWVRARLAGACIALIAVQGAPAGETALDRYVKRPDPSYSWKVVDTIERDGGKRFIVALTSQSWRTREEVDRTLWEHWLVVEKPAEVRSPTAFLFIGGGRNRPDAPKGPDDLVAKVASETGTVAAELRMVPNQPIVFNGDGKGRSEDDLIAYTWDQYLKTGDETWPARLPMVKSAVRAMDCVQELLGSEQGGKVAVEKFVVAGGSKRGWTTWCTAAVDPRVAAAIPIVIDVLNVAVSMRHHVAAYGFYSAAVGDYHEQGLMQKDGDPRLKQLYDIEDPYSYRDRLTMPKYVVNASGDEFFCPDSSQFYWDDLKGEKLLRYVPNAPHSLRSTDAGESIVAFYQMVVSGKPRPGYSWTFEKDGSIRVTAKEKPRAARLWQATNPSTRDFRFYAIGKAYKETTLEPAADGVYTGKVDPPAKGWTAFFVELDFDVGAKSPLKLSSAVRILPEVLPHAGIVPSKAPLEKLPERKK